MHHLAAMYNKPFSLSVTVLNAYILFVHHYALTLDAPPLNVGSNGGFVPKKNKCARRRPCLLSQMFHIKKKKGTVIEKKGVHGDTCAGGKTQAKGV